METIQPYARDSGMSKGRTILIEASARLMNVGATSPSWPAASSAEASHNDKIVPTSWAKDSVHDLS